jgi:hypothetical protein
MGIELCQGCAHYQEAAFADITPHIDGYCFKLEWPFSIAIFKEETEGAMTAPSSCDVREDKV